MVVDTIIIALLAASAAVYANKFFQNRKDAQKYEAKADSLTRELSDLRCELARKENNPDDATVPLTKETIVDFLKREKTGEVIESPDKDRIIFDMKDRYYIDCSRLPQQFIILKGYRGIKDVDIHWDILEQAAMKVTMRVVMVKMHVKANESYNFMIVSTTRTVAGLREDFEFFLSVIADAERKLEEEYWKIMEILHPEECVDEQENTDSAKVEDFTTKMAKMSGNRKKIQS